MPAVPAMVRSLTSVFIAAAHPQVRALCMLWWTEGEEATEGSECEPVGRCCMNINWFFPACRLGLCLACCRCWTVRPISTVKALLFGLVECSQLGV